MQDFPLINHNSAASSSSGSGGGSGGGSGVGDGTSFQSDLRDYLGRISPVLREGAYKLRRVIDLLDCFDFSAAAVALVPSGKLSLLLLLLLLSLLLCTCTYIKYI